MLNNQKINTLIEALDSWECKDAVADILDKLLEQRIGAPLPPPEIVVMRKKREQDATIRKERSIMLKAKPLQMRDGLDAAQVFSAAVAAPVPEKRDI